MLCPSPQGSVLPDPRPAAAVPSRRSLGEVLTPAPRAPALSSFACAPGGSSLPAGFSLTLRFAHLLGSGFTWPVSRSQWGCWWGRWARGEAWLGRRLPSWAGATVNAAVLCLPRGSVSGPVPEAPTWPCELSEPESWSTTLQPRGDGAAGTDPGGGQDATSPAGGRGGERKGGRGDFLAPGKARGRLLLPGRSNANGLGGDWGGGAEPLCMRAHALFQNQAWPPEQPRMVRVPYHPSCGPEQPLGVLLLFPHSSDGIPAPVPHRPGFGDRAPERTAD